MTRTTSVLCTQTVVSGSVPALQALISQISPPPWRPQVHVHLILTFIRVLCAHAVDFSRFSESFDDIMNCRRWDVQSLCSFTLWKKMWVLWDLHIIVLSFTFQPASQLFGIGLVEFQHHWVFYFCRTQNSFTTLFSIKKNPSFFFLPIWFTFDYFNYSI